MPDVSVLIVTYNSEDQIVGCLRSLLDQRKAISQEVIVLDNSPTPGTATIVREQFPEVRLLTPGKNLGFAAGVNAAAKEARGEFLLLLNPDTIVLRNAVDVIVAFARANPKYAIFGGRAQKLDGTLEPSSCWGLPSLWSLLMFASGLSAIGRRYTLLNPESMGSWQRDTAREVDMISGCFLLVGRDIWNSLRGFDERFFMYGEDADLAMRARLAGWRSLMCPTAEFIHEIGKSSETPLHKMILLYKGKATLIRTHPSSLWRAISIRLLLTGVFIRAVSYKVYSRVRNQPNDERWYHLWTSRREWTRGYAKL